MEVTLKEGYSDEVSLHNSGFNPCFNGSDSKRVSSLLPCTLCKCFNPCFNGSDSKSRINNRLQTYPLSFNPCFNGSDSKRWLMMESRGARLRFQSLF